MARPQGSGLNPSVQPQTSLLRTFFCRITCGETLREAAIIPLVSAAPETWFRVQSSASCSLANAVKLVSLILASVSFPVRRVKVGFSVLGAPAIGSACCLVALRGYAGNGVFLRVS